MTYPVRPGYTSSSTARTTPPAPEPDFNDLEGLFDYYIQQLPPDDPYRDTLIAMVPGYAPRTPPASQAQLEGSVYTQDGQFNPYAVRPRGLPENENDPYFAENYGITDQFNPWLIQPNNQQMPGAGAQDATERLAYRWRFGIPAINPIAPQAPTSQYTPMRYEDRGGAGITSAITNAVKNWTTPQKESGYGNK